MVRVERSGLRSRALRGLALVTCSLLLGACVATSATNATGDSGGDDWASDREIATARAVLMGLATYEEMQGTVLGMLEEIRQSLDAEVGTADWIHDSVSRDVGGCTPAESEVDGAFSEETRSRGVIPSGTGQTERALKIIEEVAGRHGYAPSSRLVDGVGDQYVDYNSDRGGKIVVATGERLQVLVASDCYLTAEAKAEGSL